MDLKKLITRYLQNNIGESKDVALMFSGGTDSLTCLFSLLDIGIKPTLYTFYLEGEPNKDLEISKEVANYYNLHQKVIEIKKDTSQLKQDVKYIIEKLNIDRKTNVQCAHPFLKVAPYVKEKYVVSGLFADDIYGTSKSMIIKGSKDHSEFNEMREKKVKDPLSSAYLPIKVLLEKYYGKQFLCPYRDECIVDFFMRHSWAELNKPKQKQIAIDSYNDEFSKQKIYRRNSNLQVESKIREWHDTLVETDLNFKGRKRPDEIYKDIRKELQK